MGLLRHKAHRKYQFTSHVITQRNPGKPFVFTVDAPNERKAKNITKIGFSKSYPEERIIRIKVGNKKEIE